MRQAGRLARPGWLAQFTANPPGALTRSMQSRSEGDEMPYYRMTGEVPRKRHIRFRDAAGHLYAEELMGEEGFVSDSSLLYHRHPPTAIVKSAGVRDAVAEAAVRPNHPLLPRHYRTQDLPAGG